MRRVAMGDPQAPFERVLAILDRHRLLKNDRLADDVFLISIGDHFDWGGASDRARATLGGIALLEWLNSHPPEQVVLLAGNHDLARVGELLHFSEEAWERTRTEADVVRDTNAGEAAFLLRHPELSSAQIAYRDLASFDVAQRNLVLRLLSAGRYRIAYAPQPELLLSHAGVTVDDLLAVNAPLGSAPDIARALNHAFDEAFRRWDGTTPFEIPGLYRPGSASFGEARGMLYHRPANPDFNPDAARFAGPLRRRFDPRRLPLGIVQAVGHIRDSKCRDLLGPWADDAAAVNGPLRSMTVRGNDVRYAHGTQIQHDSETASMLFLDGGMLNASIEDYELLDLDTLHAYTP